jgi:hypothetical protein
MGTGAAQRTTPEIRRYVAVDEEGTGLRVTWRPAHGFVNLSIWRDDRCVETFHLEPAEAGRLIGFLAETLTAEVPPSGSARLRLAEPADAEQRPVAAVAAATERVAAVVVGARRRISTGLASAARHLRS